MDFTFTLRRQNETAGDCLERFEAVRGSASSRGSWANQLRDILTACQLGDERGKARARNQIKG